MIASNSCQARSTLCMLDLLDINKVIPLVPVLFSLIYKDVLQFLLLSIIFVLPLVLSNLNKSPEFSYLCNYAS